MSRSQIMLAKTASNLEYMTVSKNAQVSIKIEKNQKLNRDQVQQNDKQKANNEQSSQTTTAPTDDE
jgi:hypothetical protein